jgi:hypothetical protein
MQVSEQKLMLALILPLTALSTRDSITRYGVSLTCDHLFLLLCAGGSHDLSLLSVPGRVFYVKNRKFKQVRLDPLSALSLAVLLPLVISQECNQPLDAKATIRFLLSLLLYSILSLLRTTGRIYAASAEGAVARGHTVDTARGAAVEAHDGAPLT